jgi:hypothetical protein
MSVYSGPEVVNNGLVLALDAANIKSYTGFNFTSPARMNNSTTYSSLYSITVNSSGRFVAVGQSSGATNYPIFATSSDGSTWTTPANMNGSTTGAIMTSVAVNSSGLFVAVGWRPTTAYPIFATSSDGSTWTTPANMNGSTTQAQMNALTVNSSGLFVAVGSSGGLGSVPLYATSSNGSTWTTPASMNGSSTYAIMTAIAVNSSGLFVAIGYDSVQAPLYATSSNGSTWTTPARMNGSATIAYMQAITVNSSGLFVAVGYDSSGAGVFATSSNGSTWTTPARMNGSAITVRMESVAVSSNGLFVAIGIDGNNDPSPGRFATSSDGSTWTTPANINNSSATNNINGIAVNSSGLFVVIGTDSVYGASTYSTNILKWNDISGSAIDGTLVNTPTFNGANGGYISFTYTSNQNVTFSSSSTIQFLNTLPYTLEAWVYPTRNPGAGNYTGIFNREDSSVGAVRDGYNLWFLGSATTQTSFTSERFAAGVQTYSTFNIDSSLSVNNWQHIVATYNGATVKIYRNGVFYNSVASTGNITNNVKTLEIGMRSTQPFDGRIALAKIYNTALTDEEIVNNFNAHRGRFNL